MLLVTGYLLLVAGYLLLVCVPVIFYILNELVYFLDKPLIKLIDEYDILGKKINKFIQYVEDNWNKNK